MKLLAFIFLFGPFCIGGGIIFTGYTSGTMSLGEATFWGIVGIISFLTMVTFIFPQRDTDTDFFDDNKPLDIECIYEERGNILFIEFPSKGISYEVYHSKRGAVTQATVHGRKERPVLHDANNSYRFGRTPMQSAAMYVANEVKNLPDVR